MGIQKKKSNKMAGKGKTSAQKAAAGKVQRKKKRVETFSVYIYKVLKNIHPEVGMSKKAMAVMNSFVMDLFERLALESSKLVRYHGKQTMTSNDVQSAVKLVLPGDLSEHAVAEGTRALNKFGSSSA